MTDENALKTEQSHPVAGGLELYAANNNYSVTQQRLQAIIKAATHFSPEAAQSGLLQWLMRISRTDLELSRLQENQPLVWHTAEKPMENEDWAAVCNLSGHTRDEFASAATPLPLTAAEIGHFRRNHRGSDLALVRRLRVPEVDLPESVLSLYALYQERAIADTEATLFIAQASGSTRVARLMADLQAIGSFSNAHHVVHNLTQTFAVAVAFDTSDLIDTANHEAARRLALHVNHPAHLLKLSPDQITSLAADIVEKQILSADMFAAKAQFLAEARQDVNRFPPSIRYRVAVTEGDLPPSISWVRRIGLAYSRLFPSWVADMSQIGINARGQSVNQA